MHVSELTEGSEVIFTDVPNGVVFKRVATMAPSHARGTAIVNVAKLKGHSMGITGCVKNLQGLCSRRFHQFCTPAHSLFSAYEPQYHEHFHSDFQAHVKALYAEHVTDEIPRWGRPGDYGGLWIEQWCQRTLDFMTITRPLLNIVEGIYSQDGNGFGVGPHPALGPHNVTSRDYLSNVVLFGLDPFRVDMIAHVIAGHEPGNFGLFHLAVERGLSDTVNPRDIGLWQWNDGDPTPTSLQRLPRQPLVSNYLRRDWAGLAEAEYHLCDEPYEYVT